MIGDRRIVFAQPLQRSNLCASHRLRRWLTYLSYVAKREQPVWRPRLQRAYNRPEYDAALAALKSLQHELEDRNQSAAGSLAEGLDETLTLHRLGVYGVLGRSLKTTNGLGVHQRAH